MVWACEYDVASMAVYRGLRFGMIGKLRVDLVLVWSASDW